MFIKDPTYRDSPRTTNISVGSQGYTFHNVLIVRLDNSDTVIDTRDLHGSMNNIRIEGKLPSLWRWLRLWWFHRSLRRTQLTPIAGIVHNGPVTIINSTFEPTPGHKFHVDFASTEELD